MNLRVFLDETRKKLVARAQSVPEDHEWSIADAWKHYDIAVSQMLIYALPESIELDPE